MTVANMTIAKETIANDTSANGNSAKEARADAPLSGRRGSAWALALALALTMGVGAAPPTAFAQDGDRFQLVPMGEGALRLDKGTGTVEMCVGEGDAYECRTVVEAVPVVGEQSVAEADLIAENERLRAEVADLTERLATIAALAEVAAQEGSEDAGEGRGTAMAARARREIDQALELTDYALRRFRDLYQSWTEEDVAQ